jgi:2-haloacid dehalogenase
MSAGEPVAADGARTAAGWSGRPVEAVVFDLGGVLVQWDPARIYRSILGDDDQVEDFFDEVGFSQWNHSVDAGERTWAEAVADLTARYPHRGELIAAYPARFAESLVGQVDGTVAILRELHDAGVRLVALTNWSAELFPHALERYDFLGLFEAIVVSGQERIAKPDPRIYHLVLDRHHLDPARTVFVDDRLVNVAAARSVGMQGFRFTDPEQLRHDLAGAGALPA